MIEVYRYIEMNQVRAKMVDDPGECVLSRYQVNALGKDFDLCMPHSEYLKLGEAKSERMENYCALFAYHVEGDLLNKIRLSLNKGMAIDNDRFKEEVEELTGVEQRQLIESHLQENSGLKSKNLELIEKSYMYAVTRAVRETGLATQVFPQKCPWSYEQFTNEDFWPKT